jgi:hypothetical protein
VPKPSPGEPHDDFIDRCIPIVIDDGTAQSPEQAVAVCESIWRQEQSAAVRSVLSELRRGDARQDRDEGMGGY